MLKPSTDAGITTGLSEAIETLLPALNEFMRFEDKDLAASEYAQWFSSLNEGLPERGRGAEATLQILKDVVIPRGLRTGGSVISGCVREEATPLKLLWSVGVEVDEPCAHGPRRRGKRRIITF